ncbi:DUF294 nucleotidyltransferase-like domain-containing protein [Paenibacillus sp. LHD-117]|uniref:DUF294 nucleotidyltransferase-like domain-containing protein n=1 Tax=Paenibacillus sp. LHD-117 TaxID=3071412 RepID=UPI0027DFA9FC|nr:DUF294 nucleotidyltransferase-like domain-containing protein [Paenibacillus sp. LHD-117]MDQ6423299.1 DUF294 nucleotidyltransferase-like domain-containing protein [Paenibacillus sp. LHD-117]
MGDPARPHHFKMISAADRVEGLRSLRDQIHEQMEALLPIRPVEQLNEQLNETHDALITKAIMLSEADMARMGKGSPPVPYAYLLFGSGGRKEQTLSSDQDSGVVYRDPAENGEEVKAYFLELCHLIVMNLINIGYPPCEGKVLSDNPDWCHSLSEWRTKLEGWFREPAWESVRYLLIIADGRCVYGDEGVADSLKDVFFSDTLNHPMIIRRMIENTMRHKVLVGIFGQLLKERYGEDAGSLDIKYGAYIPMVNSIRMMAIQANIRETSTLERIRNLVELGKLSSADGSKYEQAFRFILRLRLVTTEQKEGGLYANNGKLHSSKLTKEMTDELKSSLRQGKRLQRSVYKQTMGRLM